MSRRAKRAATRSANLWRSNGLSEFRNGRGPSLTVPEGDDVIGYKDGRTQWHAMPSALEQMQLRALFGTQSKPVL